MDLNLTRQLVRLFVIAGCVAVSNPASALLIDVIGDTSSERIFDGGAGDLATDTGIIHSVFSNVDDFRVFATVGQSKPQIGSAEIPKIELSSVKVDGGTGSIRIVVYDDGFLAVNDPLWDFTLDSVVGSFRRGSTMDGSGISVSAYFDVNNNYLTAGIEEGELFTSLNGSGSILKVDEIGLTFPGTLTAPYGLALVADITHMDPRLLSSFNTALRDPPRQPVPEPAIIVLVGLGLTGLGMLGHRRNRAPTSKRG